MSSIKLRPYLRTAKVWSEESTCCRLKVGAVIFNTVTGQILSTGYNGTAKDKSHCVDVFKNYNLTDPAFLKSHHEFSERYEIHAEQNAIYNLLKSKTSISENDNLALVTTIEPCMQCAKALLALGVKEVYFIDKYDRGSEAVEYFKEVGILCKQVTC